MKVGEEDRLGQGRLEKPRLDVELDEWRRAAGDRGDTRRHGLGTTLTIAPVREDQNPATERAGR